MDYYFAHAAYVADLDDAVHEIIEAGYIADKVLPDAVYSTRLNTPSREDAVRLAHRNLTLVMTDARRCM